METAKPGLTIEEMTLFAETHVEVSELDVRLAATAAAWQALAHDSLFNEGLAVAQGIEPNRMYELEGRMASMGEQLAMAHFALRDARAWLAHRGDVEYVRPRARALAEVAAYYVLGVGHGLFNVTARLLACDGRNRAILTKQFPRSSGLPPFSSDRNHWLSFNESAVTRLRAAAAHQMPGVRSLVDELAVLVRDVRWTAVTARRDVDYHRWRPQSTTRSVAPAEPWLHLPDQVRLLTVYDGGTHVPEEHEVAIAEVGYALDALDEAMGNWLRTYPDAKHWIKVFAAAAMAGELLDGSQEPS